MSIRSRILDDLLIRVQHIGTAVIFLKPLGVDLVDVHETVIIGRVYHSEVESTFANNFILTIDLNKLLVQIEYSWYT